MVDHVPMGIRFNTRVGKSTSVSFSLWLVLLPVLLVCGLIGVVVQHPAPALRVIGSLTVLGLGIWALSAWIARKMDERDERRAEAASKAE